MTEATFCGNALLSINNVTPYNAVYGRVPTLLPDINSSLPDGEGLDTASRDSNRLREIAVQAMVEGTARARIQRALRAKTQTAAQETLAEGMEVDFYRDPKQKDLPGWSGPARIVDMSDASRGTIKISYRGRELICSPGDLRESLSFVALLAAPHLTNHHDRAIQTIRRWLDHAPPGRIHVFGLVRGAEPERVKHEAKTERLTPPPGWRHSENTIKHAVIDSALCHLAEVTLGYTGVVAFRLGTGVPVIPSTSDYTSTVMMAWHQNHPDDYTFHEMPALQAFNLRQSYGEAWHSMRWIQLHFLAEDEYPAAQNSKT